MQCCDIFDVFDLKNNLIKEYEYWFLLIRNKNSTLGNCVAITKRHMENFSEILQEEMMEFQVLVKDVEQALKKSFDYDKINYMMLMMKDKHTHFHILPRYSKPISFSGTEWTDSAWPSMERIFSDKKESLPQELLNKIKKEIIKNI